MTVEGGRSRAGHVALWASAAGYGSLLVWQAFNLPDRVPGHVGLFGEVTRWGTRGEHLTIGVGSLALMLGLFALLPRVMGRMNTSMLNLPHKAYWSRPENWPVAQRMLAEDMGWLGAGMLAFFTYAMWFNGAIARGENPNPWLFLVVVGLTLAAAIGYGIWASVGSRWRPPADVRR